MTLEQLRIFVAVAERQHITRAAEALNQAQSAVSAAISALEAQHAVKLFHRVGRGIQLTEAGTIFLDEARAVLLRAGEAELMLSELGGLKRGRLNVQASQTIASYWLPRHLVAFRRDYPGIDINLTIGNTASVAQAVHEGTAELGFVEGRVEDASLISQFVAEDQLIIVVAPDHPWAGQKNVNPNDLLQADWVLREPGSGTRSVFEDALLQFDLDPARLKIALELPSNEAVRSAVEAGMGTTAISASVAVPSLDAGLLHHVPMKLPKREFHVLRHMQRYHSKAASKLWTIVKPR